MALICGLVLAILEIVASTASRVLSEDFKAWAPWVRKRIIERAVRNSPKDLRERLAEEWPSHVEEIPGDIGKLIVAFGFLAASWNLSQTTKYEVAKRVLDVALSGLLIIIIGPLLVVIGLAIRSSSPEGPVLFRQVRIGRNGQVFKLYKFRTAKWAIKPRVTRVGSFLRRTSLDELPLLFNVIQGDMSFVGPRPLPLNVDEIPSVLRSSNVKPGLSGWSQINGGETARRHELDTFYVKNRSFLLDFKIILKTCWIVFRG
jgi:lipopolysaccharide/colanic/teichoic acid biosynthesis glycosyltransferase